MFVVVYEVFHMVAAVLNLGQLQIWCHGAQTFWVDMAVLLSWRQVDQAITTLDDTSPNVFDIWKKTQAFIRDWWP